MRRARNRRRAGNGGLRHRLAVGADDHRHLHLLGVGAGVGRFQVDDVAQEDFSLVQFVAPDDDGLERQRAFAQACDHRLAAGLDALGDGDFALAREQFDRAHFAQIHAHRIVGALGRLFLLGGGERLRLGLDHFAAGSSSSSSSCSSAAFSVSPSSPSASSVSTTLMPISLSIAMMSSICSGEVEFGRQHGIERVEGDEAALLGGLDHLLDAGVVEIEQRQRGVGRAFGFLFRGLFLDLSPLPCSPSSFLLGPFWPCCRGGSKQPPYNIGHGQKGPRRQGAAPESGRQCRRNPLKLRLTLINTAGIDPLFPAGPAFPGLVTFAHDLIRKPVPTFRGHARHAHKLRAPRPEEAPKPSIRASVPSMRDKRALTSRSRK